MAKVREIGSAKPMMKILTTKEALTGLIRDELPIALALGKMLEHFGPKMEMLNRVYLNGEGREPCLMAFWEILDAVVLNTESATCPMSGRCCPRD